VTGANDKADRDPSDASGFEPARQCDLVGRVIARHDPAGLEQTAGHVGAWASLIGPCYTAHGIGAVTGLSVDEVIAATAQLDLLAVETSDGVMLYPTFQVVDGAVVSELGQVLRTLRTGFGNSWMWAQWLRSTPPPIDGKTICRSQIERLVCGDVDGVMLAATHTAWAWRT